MNIFSPMATGNGAYVVHQSLARELCGYRVCGYNPYWTLLPPILPFLVRNMRNDIIHTTPDYAYFFRRENIPLVVTFHNFVLDQFMMAYSSRAQRLHYKTTLRYLTNKSLKISSAVTSVSNYTADLMRKELGYRAEIKVIYNGVDSELFRPERKPSGRKIKVLFCGNLTRRKGATLLPLIANRLDSGVEIIYTEGLRTRNSFADSDNLKNIGAVPFPLMPQVYLGADILLFPTVREGLPLAVIEAMACGLPVVATNCSSLPELVVDGTGGYLCELGNVDEFVTRINQLAAAPGLRQEMGEFNRIRVEEKFTVERMIKEYAALFEQVLSGN